MGFSTTGGRRGDRIRYKRLDDKVMVRIKAFCGSCRNIEVQKQCVIIQQKMKNLCKDMTSAGVDSHFCNLTMIL